MKGLILTPHVEPQAEPQDASVLRCGFDGKPYAIFVVNVVPPNGDHPGAEFYFWINAPDHRQRGNYTAQFVDRLNPNKIHVYVAAECVRLADDEPAKWAPVEAVMPWHFYTPGQLLREVINASTNRS